MIGEIKVKIPYPVKVWFFTISVSREIGFSFDQRAILTMLENNGIDLNDYKDWTKDKAHSFIFSETLYAAAQSYCMKYRIKDNFDKVGLIKGFAELSEENQKKIADTYMKSESLGFKKMPGKKKAAKH